jgi:hypothetical protein
MKRIVVSLIVAIFLAAAASPAIKAQGSSKDASAKRERLRRIMDPATDVEEFRRELDSFYADLQASTNTMLESEFARDLMARSGLDPLGQLAEARKMLPEMTAQDLGVLKAAFARNLSWREMPDRINSLLKPGIREVLKSIHAPQVPGPGFSMKVMPSPVTQLPVVSPPAIIDICTHAETINADGTTTPFISNSDIAVAAAAEIAAGAVADGIPDTLVPAHVAAIVLDSVAKGALLALQTLKSISDDCSTLDFQNYVTANLDEQVSTRASQTSVNNLQTSLNADTTSILSEIDSKFSLLSTQINTATNTIINNNNTNTTNIINNDNSNKAMIINELHTVGCEVIRLLNTPMGQRSSNIQSCVGQPGFPYDFNHNGGKTAATPASATVVTTVPTPGLAPVSRGQDGVPILPLVGTVTMETHLLDGRLIPTYYLPAARGGMIEQVQLLVWNTINSQVELEIAKDRTEQARQLALQADQLLSRKKYVEAYRQYSLAYQTLVPAS